MRSEVVASFANTDHGATVLKASATLHLYRKLLQLPQCSSDFPALCSARGDLHQTVRTKNFRVLFLMEIQTIKQSCKSRFKAIAAMQPAPQPSPPLAQHSSHSLSTSGQPQACLALFPLQYPRLFLQLFPHQMPYQ